MEKPLKKALKGGGSLHPLYRDGRCAHDRGRAREWSLHFVTAEIMLSPTASLFSAVHVPTWPCTREKWRCEICGCCLATPREGGLCATQQTQRTLLTFFFPSTSRAVELCRCADSKMPFGLCFWAVCIAQRQGFVERVLFPKRRVPFIRRKEAIPVVEFRLPPDDSLNFWRAIYCLFWMKLQCILNFFYSEGRKTKILSIVLIYNRKTLNFHRLKASPSVHVQVYATMLLSEIRQRCTLLPVNSHHSLCTKSHCKHASESSNRILCGSGHIICS